MYNSSEYVNSLPNWCGFLSAAIYEHSINQTKDAESVLSGCSCCTAYGAPQAAPLTHSQVHTIIVASKIFETTKKPKWLTFGTYLIYIKSNLSVRLSVLCSLRTVTVLKFWADLHKIWHVASLYPTDGHGGGGVSGRCLSLKACAHHAQIGRRNGLSAVGASSAGKFRTSGQIDCYIRNNQAS